MANLGGPRLSKARILRMMGTVRPLFRAFEGARNYSDDAIADALVATARADPESWFGEEHIRAAYDYLLSH